MVITEPSPSKSSGARGVLDELLPVIDVVPVAGPPVLFLAAPWLLLVLMLAGPFALLVTLAVLVVATVLLVALAAAVAGALLASPYLLARRVIAHLAARPRRTAPVPAPAASLVAIHSREVRA